MENKTLTIEDLKIQHHKRFNVDLDEETIKSAVNCLNLEFHTEKYQKDGGTEATMLAIGEIYKFEFVVLDKLKISIGKTLSSCLSEELFKEYLIDSVSYSLSVFNKRVYASQFVKGFIRY